MSDPMSRQQIEDVLTSIRRLVSEDLRRPDAPRIGETRSDPQALYPFRSVAGSLAQPEFPDAEAEVAELAGSSADTDAGAADEPVVPDEAALHVPPAEPLVLTPALRVVTASAGFDAEAATTAGGDARRASLEETIAELEAAIAGVAGEWERGDATVLPRLPDDGLAEDAPARPRQEALETGAAAEDGGSPEPEAAPAAPYDDMDWLAARISDAAARARRRGQGGMRAGLPGRASLPDAGVTHGAAEGDAEALDPQVASEGFYAAGLMPGEAAAPASPPAPIWVDAEEADLEPPVAEIRAEAGVTQPPRRLHLAGGLDWPDEARAALREPSDARAHADDDAGDAEELADLPFLASAEEAAPLIDEAALRAIVAEIIREELQGELGERITRSVRKLVRREVLRALSSRDLD